MYLNNTNAENRKLKIKVVSTVHWTTFSVEIFPGGLGGWRQIADLTFLTIMVLYHGIWVNIKYPGWQSGGICLAAAAAGFALTLAGWLLVEHDRMASMWYYREYYIMCSIVKC